MIFYRCCLSYLMNRDKPNRAVLEKNSPLKLQWMTIYLNTALETSFTYKTILVNKIYIFHLKFYCVSFLIVLGAIKIIWTHKKLIVFFKLCIYFALLSLMVPFNLFTVFCFVYLFLILSTVKNNISELQYHIWII